MLVDIHNHILPGIDDGAKDLEESIEIANMYIERGVNSIIATPHYIEGTDSTSKTENIGVLEKVKKELKDRNMDLKIYLGNEVYIVPGLVSLLKENQAASLNESRYVLIELPMREVPMYFNQVLYEMQLEGYIPIIAHPERNLIIQKEPHILKEALEGGALAQLNLPSILGIYGSPSKETGMMFLKSDYYQFIATDTHGSGKRSPEVLDDMTILKAILDEDKLRELIFENPIKVLENKSIEVGPVGELMEENSFLKKFKSIFRRL